MALAASEPPSVDVLVVGGGPVGLLLTYILLQSRVKVLTIEQYDKFEQALFGRACILHAGSVELLDTFKMYDRIADIGFIVRDAITYKDGDPVTNRGWYFVDKAIIGNTSFDYSFSIRQKHLEDAVRDSISEIGTGSVKTSTKLLNYRVDGSSKYPVIATIEHEGRVTEVACKYLIGADGGRSTIRSLGKFAFPGTSSSHKWIRLDAIVKTNMPSGRNKIIAIESVEFGNILWTPTDNGRTRIGFVCPPDVYGEDGTGITDEIIMAAAKRAMAPFTLEFELLEWWTVYSIGQRIAEKFRDGPIFLAGDAAHTHSSGTGQGMNTGIHDSINLGWKLAGVLSGTYDESILDTYDAERRASAEHLIQLDRDVSALISGTIPSHFNAPPDANFNDYLEIVHQRNASFTVGLGISYGPNLLNQIPPAEKTPLPNLNIGHHTLDAPLFRPGVMFPMPLRSFTRYNGRFWVLVFAGKLEPTTDSVRLNSKCATKYRALRDHVDSASSFTHTLTGAFEFLTILQGEGSLQSSETIGARPLGKALYDHSGEAYSKYGVDGANGAIAVLRPDGVVCFSAPLDGGNELSDYFHAFVRPSEYNPKMNGRKVATQNVGGEISIEGQEESTQISTLVS